MRGADRQGIDAAGGVQVEASSDVFVNGAGFARDGDRVQSHGTPPHSPMPPMIATTGTVFVNNILACRKNDPATCGHTLQPGSPDVFVGD